ncbi:MAG: RluA family pseudouridine synthase [Deltaproteobacteria bacterium]|nr:RluA family pseudouridine synthase [Deltaproteobacteria bacterium]
MSTDSDKTQSFRVNRDEKDGRLDQFLTSHEKNLTRSRAQALIRGGYVRVNEGAAKPSYRLKTGDCIALSIPPARTYDLKPQRVEFRVVHEDSSLIVVDKPPGLVIHPAPGHYEGTLVHGLLNHCRDLAGIGGELRPGIVHRLDKDTSGLMVVVKNNYAHAFLSAQFRARKVNKQYIAIVHGIIRGDEGIIDLPISRHPVRRKEMSVSHLKGRNAVTRWRKKEDLAGRFSLLLITPRTGRTHQIRVHFSHAGHPIVGDPLYGFRSIWWKKHFPPGVEVVKRQMLHAEKLGFIHPDSGQYCEFHAPVPEDMGRVLAMLRANPP